MGQDEEKWGLPTDFEERTPLCSDYVPEIGWLSPFWDRNKKTPQTIVFYRTMPDPKLPPPDPDPERYPPGPPNPNWPPPSLPDPGDPGPDVLDPGMPPEPLPA